MCYAVFGFATSETLIERKEANAGLRDQRAALDCMRLYPKLIPTHNTDIVDQPGIRDHVEAFGGDPDRGTALSFSILGVRALTKFLLVTVVGQSVGAADIGLQLMAFGGEKTVPFQQAM